MFDLLSLIEKLWNVCCIHTYIRGRRIIGKCIVSQKPYFVIILLKPKSIETQILSKNV